jgi:hypothetical protein
LVESFGQVAEAFLCHAQFVAGDVVVTGCAGYSLELAESLFVGVFFEQGYAQVTARQEVGFVGDEDLFQDGDGRVVAFVFHEVEGVFIAEEFGEFIFGVGGFWWLCGAGAWGQVAQGF